MQNKKSNSFHVNYYFFYATRIKEEEEETQKIKKMKSWGVIGIMETYLVQPLVRLLCSYTLAGFLLYHSVSVLQPPTTTKKREVVWYRSKYW